MNGWLDYIQVWNGCSLGISDDLINFWNESIKKWLPQPLKKIHGGRWVVPSIDGYFLYSYTCMYLLRYTKYMILPTHNGDFK